MNAIFFALISYVGWGAGDIFGAIAARRIGGFKTTFWIMTAAALLFAPLTIIYWHFLVTTSPAVIIAAIFIGFFYQSANFALNEALNKTSAAIALTIMGSFGAFIVLFSTIFLHEPISIIQAVIIAIIFTGVCLSTFASKVSISRKELHGIFLAVYTSISAGIFFTAVKIFSPTLGWFWPIYLSFLWLPIIYLYLVRTGIRPSINDVKTTFVPLAWNFLLLRGTDFIFNMGLQTGLAAIVAPIASASPTLSVILAFIVFHEKPNRRQIIGIILALTGIVALGFTQ